MANSWKEMQLLNIVKFRYFDPPVFLDVPSVVSQQELYGQADVSARLFSHPLKNVASGQPFYNLDALGRYTDRPTVSYTPITGDRFINILLRPIPPATILSMIDTGHDASFILRMAVSSINGLHNYSLGRMPKTQGSGSWLLHSVAFSRPGQWPRAQSRWTTNPSRRRTFAGMQTLP
jgi:hypothetical protein